MSSIIILAKGPSAERCTEEFVRKHEEVMICNHIPRNIPDFEFMTERCDYLFKVTEFLNEYTTEDMKAMNVKKVLKDGLFSSRSKEKKYLGVDAEMVHIQNKIMKKPGFGKGSGPSCGLLALEYCVRKNYKHITLVGMDLQKKDDRMYFYDFKLASTEINKVYSNHVVKDDKIAIKLHHPEDATRKYMLQRINESPDITFEIMTNDDGIKQSSNSMMNLKVY